MKFDDEGLASDVLEAEKGVKTKLTVSLVKDPYAKDLTLSARVKM
jgi:hypothetical protein